MSAARKKKRPARAPAKKPARAKAPKKAAPTATKRATSKAPKKAGSKKRVAPKKRVASTRKAAPSRAKAIPATKKLEAKAAPEINQALARALRGHVFDVVVDGGAAGEAHEKAVDAALQSFRAHLPSALLEAAGHVFLYYLDCKGSFQPGEAGHVEIGSPKDVWKHVHFGPHANVGLRESDGKVYVSLECACDWEEEHGLQIVLEEGRRVVKVGPFDGHLTNVGAYDDPSLEGVVYRRQS